MVRKAFVDREICIGCNVCAIECATVFTVKEDPEHDNSFKSFPDDSVDQEPVADKVEKAINMCPVSCISWRDAKAGNDIQTIESSGTPHKPSHHEEKQEAVAAEQK